MSMEYNRKVQPMMGEGAGRPGEERTMSFATVTVTEGAGGEQKVRRRQQGGQAWYSKAAAFSFVTCITRSAAGLTEPLALTLSAVLLFPAGQQCGGAAAGARPGAGGEAPRRRGAVRHVACLGLHLMLPCSTAVPASLPASASHSPSHLLLVPLDSRPTALQRTTRT